MAVTLPIRRRHDSYLRATRHPWPCLLFLGPLLLLYEGGVLWLGAAEPEALRNGVDAWLRWGLHSLGLRATYWPPVLIVGILAGWSWLRRRDRPRDLAGVWLGMALESVAFALVLWGLGQIQTLPQVTVRSSQWGVCELRAVTCELERAPAGVAQVLTFIGAGIYEELLFRLVLLQALRGLLVLTEAPRSVALSGAMLVSALLFAGMHHLGPYGEPFQAEVFGFRLLAGLYFALLFVCRGFGVAAGAHAGYDVLIGVSAG